MTITVICVDDHPLIRSAVRSLLEPKDHIDLVAEGSVGAHVSQLVEKHRPDVLILDMGMPMTEEPKAEERFFPLPTVARLNREYPATAVIFLTQYASPVLIKSAIELGVRGYLLKSDNLSLHLPEAVEVVYRGGVYFSRQISDLLFKTDHHSPPSALLSTRQLEIILAIAKAPDITYQQLAYELSITESTLKGHLNKAFKALEVTNITACIITCMQLGLIPFMIDERGGIHFGSLLEHELSQC